MGYSSGLEGCLTQPFVFASSHPESCCRARFPLRSPLQAFLQPVLRDHNCRSSSGLGLCAGVTPTLMYPHVLVSAVSNQPQPFLASDDLFIQNNSYSVFYCSLSPYVVLIKEQSIQHLPDTSPSKAPPTPKQGAARAKGSLP